MQRSQNGTSPRGLILLLGVGIVQVVLPPGFRLLVPDPEVVDALVQLPHVLPLPLFQQHRYAVVSNHVPHCSVGNKQVKSYR